MFETLISHNAAVRPGAVALRWHPGLSYTYAEMDADIHQFASWLSTKGLLPETRAILRLADPYLHWVLFFALESLGLVTIGDAPRGVLSRVQIDELGASVVFSAEPDPGFRGILWVQVGRNWSLAIRNEPVLALPSRERKIDDPICILLSSGTTGTTKKVLIDRAMIDRRNKHAYDAEFLRPEARLILTLPFQSIGGVLAAFQAWIVGGTIGFNSPNASWRLTFESADFNTLVTAPIHLEQILANLPSDIPRRDDLVVLIGGGATSRPLFAKLRSRLTHSIATAYGTTETGLITKADIEKMPCAEDSAGPLLPGVEAQIVDDTGQIVGQGQTGEIRLRGSNVVAGYLDDDSAKCFRNGWYYPGDLGRFDDREYLLVSGRTDDLMNFGGRKAVPAAVEHVVLSLPGVDDAAAFQATIDSQQALVVLYIGTEKVEAAELKKRLGDFPTVIVARVAAIPRNPMGKIERARLRADVEAGVLSTIGDAVRLG